MEWKRADAPASSVLSHTQFRALIYVPVFRRAKLALRQIASF
jgi:hypothetical protein